MAQTATKLKAQVKASHSHIDALGQAYQALAANYNEMLLFLQAQDARIQELEDQVKALVEAGNKPKLVGF